MSSERPVTSKPRGICKYYNTPRGCYAGNQCKFLHGEAEKLTPYDKNKACKFYAAGFCRRGDRCWFQHVAPGASTSSVEAEQAEDDLCCICYEKPVTYGLLMGCSHMFCVQCIREWRNPAGKSEEVVGSGVTKQCPLCRAPSRFVTPSSQFFPEGHPGKKSTIDKYKASMARVPCRHFQRSPPDDRFCPFGKDCFYQHLNEDGTPFEFSHISNRRRSRNDFGRHPQNFLEPYLDELSAALDALRATLPDLADDFNIVISNDGGNSSPAPEPSGELATQDGEHGDRSYNEAIEMLMDFLSTVQTEELEGRTMYRFGTATPLPLDSATSADPRSDVATVASRPESPALAAPPADALPTTNHGLLETGPRLTSSSPTSDFHPRFSTVVDRPAVSANERFSRSLEDLRGLPESVEHRVYMTAPANPTLEPQAVPAVTDSTSHIANDLNQSSSSPLVSDGAPAPSTPVTTEPTTEAVGIAPWQTEVVHDADPPFLTDGRGRVVWSSTTAGRHREGRRGRSGVSVQQKPRREDAAAGLTPAVGDSAQSG